MWLLGRLSQRFLRIRRRWLERVERAVVHCCERGILAVGAEIKEHELVHVKGHAFDKLTVLDRQGKRRVVWFNTDTNEELHARALRHAKGIYP